MTAPDIVLVGLGNPGDKYKGTRHNLGFEVVDLLSQRHARRGSYMKHQAWLMPVEIGGSEILLVKPLTFMNNSGHAVRDVLNGFDVDPSAAWVVYDDYNIPLGALRMRLQGSDGGHNGIASVIASLRTQEFPRLRLGIGASPGRQSTIDYVLGTFRKSEQKTADELIAYTADAIEAAATEGLGKAMNRFNRAAADDAG
jgi:peptidyl-tRNA hydrolase, PTH1 family